MLLQWTLVLALTGCETTVPPQPPVKPATRISVAERGWHTDLCVATRDAGDWVNALALGFDGAQFLCFGFGERQYIVSREHDFFTMLSALLPSEGALLMTVLRAPPSEAFGPENVVELGVSGEGLAALQQFLRDSVQIDPRGRPIRFGEGPYVGSVFFGATETYDGLYTCNTWTAHGLRSAGLPLDQRVLFAGAVMRQARELAASESRPGL
jgi:uncharacterized protein (TIGR02117 family)